MPWPRSIDGGDQGNAAHCLVDDADHAEVPQILKGLVLGVESLVRVYEDIGVHPEGRAGAGVLSRRAIDEGGVLGIRVQRGIGDIGPVRNGAHVRGAVRVGLLQGLEGGVIAEMLLVAQRERGVRAEEKIKQQRDTHD